MKKVKQICEKCGFEEEIILGTAEEILREKRNPVSPFCKKCGNPSVKFK